LAYPAAPDASHDRPRLLVGRAHEQALLRQHLAAARAGRGSLVLIGGEAGIGKTALTETLGREATAGGALALVGRAYDLTAMPPYGPWLELFDRAPVPDGFPPFAAFLQGDAASQEALFLRLRGYLAALTERGPALLVLDDVHWADPASLDLLRFLARDLATLPLLGLVAYRTDELGRHHPLYRLLPLVVREARATRLDLRPLDDAAVGALVTARYRLPDADGARLVAHLQDRAEGNPFYLGELLHDLEEEGLLRPSAPGWALGELGHVRVPPFVRQVIDGRLGRLGEEARHLLATAAVIGQEVPLALWGTVSEVADEALLALLERAVEMRLLEAAGDGAGVRFAHALIREALYDGLLPPRRRAWHRRVGECLAETPVPEPDAVAYHFRQAGDRRAAAWLVKAGERAQRAYAWLTAADHYEAALTFLEVGGGHAQERGWLLY
jgi:predicted ATPase